MTTIWPALALAAHVAMARPTLAPAAYSAPAPRVDSGAATWYATGPGAGEAAAGRALRRALGRHWRGTVVRVCARRCIRVHLSDWCGCPGRRVVDLAPADFRQLAPTWRGLVRVRVVLP